MAMNSASASRARGDKRTLGGMAGEKNQITENLSSACDFSRRSHQTRKNSFMFHKLKCGSSQGFNSDRCIRECMGHLKS